MPSVGIDPDTGKVVTGWQRTMGSVRTIVTTEIRSRVQRRAFGSNVPALVDRPQNPEAVIDFYMAIVEALEPRYVEGQVFGEPCFEVTQLSLDLKTPGKPVIGLTGIEYPDGHLGDFTKPRQRTLQLGDYVL